MIGFVNGAMAFFVGLLLGELLLLIFGPVIRFARYIVFAPFAPLRAWNAMVDTNYRGLVSKTLWWGLAILLVVVAAISSTGNPTTKAGVSGTLLGFVAARVGYGMWDRNRVHHGGFFG